MKLLLFHIGSLGDTLASVPAMWAVREQFRGSHITLLSDRQVGKKYVTPRDVLDGSQIVDAFADYGVGGGRSARLLNPVRKLALLAWMRQQHFDAVVYLVHLHSRGSRKRVIRDRHFFRLAGVKTIMGMDDIFPWPSKQDAHPLPTIPPMAEQLLSRLRASGIGGPADRLRIDIGLNADDREKVAVWADQLADDRGRPWIAVAPGTKMPSKRWRPDRFVKVVRRLIGEFDVWPVVFGGSEDESLGLEMLDHWQRGHLAAGALSIREAAVALEQCQLYLGNDTGTMHLAASVGVPCVAIFSARDVPGAWHPLGERHRVMRSQIDCEGCMLVECATRRTECLTQIQTDEVLNACRAALGSHIKRRAS